MNPLVSVVIPCYRQAHYLAESLGSLQTQTYPHWEAIIVNDGSPDNTRQVAEDLAATDTRIRYIEKENGGLSSARNAGLDEVKGDYVQFLDADDLLDSTKFETDIALVSQHLDPIVIVNDYRFLDDQGHFYANALCQPKFISQDLELEFAVRWETQLSIPVHSYLFDAVFFRHYGLRFNQSLPNHEDWDMWMRLFALQPKLINSGNNNTIYRIAAGSMTRDNNVMHSGFLKAIDLRIEDGNTREIVGCALRAKRELTSHYYKYGWRAKLERVMDYKFIRQNMPWRIQKAVKAWGLLDLQQHMESVTTEYLLSSCESQL